MKKTVLVLSLISLGLVACQKPKQSSSEESHQTITTSSTETHSNQSAASNPIPVSETKLAPVAADHAETALDWNGEYKGILPCADCEGIKTQLELNSDKTYELKEAYLGKDKELESKVKGKFQFDKTQPSIIQLDQAANGRRFFIGENQIFAVEKESGKIIEGPLAEHYILKKELN